EFTTRVEQEGVAGGSRSESLGYGAFVVAEDLDPGDRRRTVPEVGPDPLPLETRRLDEEHAGRRAAPAEGHDPGQLADARPRARAAGVDDHHEGGETGWTRDALGPTGRRLPFRPGSGRVDQESMHTGADRENPDDHQEQGA